MQIESRIFIAGHKGLVGSAIFRKLQAQGYKYIITRDRSEVDLLNQKETEDFFRENEIEYVFDAAAKVGGIYANDTYSADFIYENLQIQNNLIYNSWKFGVKKFLFLGSVCIYPKFAPVPIDEKSLLTGPLEPTNDSYAIAKISGIKMLQSYFKQYGFQSVCLQPSNVYGPFDNFDPQNGHVIPAMMSKFRNANSANIEFWGDGSQMREFLFSEDLADACLFVMDKIGDSKLVNVGSGNNISIKDLAHKIATIANFNGQITWDLSKPNGTPNRPLDSSIMNSLGWRPRYSLDEGLELTYRWFMENKLV